MAPVDSPDDELELGLGDPLLVVEDTGEEVCELVFEFELGAELELDVVMEEDVLDPKSFASYRIEIPYPFTASVFGCSVASKIVNAEPSVTVVVTWLVNSDTQAWPMKLKSVRV